MDQPEFSVVMPAFRAESTIVAAVDSLLRQTYPHWRLLLVSDDGTDYEAVLGRAGRRDRRLRFLESGGIGFGASRARNVALDHVATPYAAVLDADDRFAPAKLARAAGGLTHAPVVSCALSVTTPDFAHLRGVGTGPDRVLRPKDHKRVNFSMDSMIAWDTRVCDGRYEPGLPNFTDLDFLLKLFRTTARSFHLGEMLHDYVKMPVSMSNGAGVSERMIAVKTLLLERLASGHYPLRDAEGAAGISAFLVLSLEAERSYPEALAREPGLLFEDHLEPRLSALSTASA